MSSGDGAARVGLRRALIALCVTEIISWGVLYYAFPVLTVTITADTGWSTTQIMAAFSSGLAVSALAGIPVGRLLDRYGPRPVMTVGSVLAAVSVVAIASAESWPAFVAAWAFSGIAQACVFYKPAFAALTGWYGPQRVKALTALTLVAGLSSTVFAPLTATLVDHTDWRTTYLVLAAVLGLITVPAHAIFLTPGWRGHFDASQRPAKGRRSQVMRSRPFIVLTAVTAVGTFALFAATMYLVPLLTDHGMSTSVAAWVFGLCGAGQLLGRVGYARFSELTSVRARTVIVLSAAAVALVATVVAATVAWMVVIAAILFGATRGVFTLLEATAVSDRWGTAGFGSVYGVYSAPSTIAMAATPFVGALLVSLGGGHRQLFIAAAVMLLVAAVAALATVPARHDRAVSDPVSTARQFGQECADAGVDIVADAPHDVDGLPGRIG